MILGIDIGTQGALALLSPDGSLVEVADMPVLRDGPKGRPAVNAPLLAAIVYRWHASQAFVEHVGARPGEGAVGAFAFGRSRGVAEGVLAACGVPATHIAPASWKRAVGRSIARDDEMPSTTAVTKWLRDFPEFREQYARASCRQTRFLTNVLISPMIQASPRMKAFSVHAFA
ncbi:MAG: hypothetical protein L0Y60_17055 [Beijerinckiaceae bacterium]|nr:hypothetical protein [Beijerinckiaceae bacterium]